MKRSTFILSCLIIMAVLAVNAHAQWYITGNLHLLSTTLPLDSMWVVTNGATLTLDPSQALQIRGTLIVAPGGSVVLDQNSSAVVHGPGGHVQLNQIHAALRSRLEVKTGAKLELHDYTTMDIAQDANLQLTGGNVRLGPNTYINSTSGRIVRTGSVGGLMTSNFRPVRGTAYLTNLRIVPTGNITIGSSDVLYFLEGGSFDYSGTGTVLNIAGQAIVESTRPAKKLCFGGNIGQINVTSTGMLSVHTTDMDSVPTIIASASSSITTTSNTWYMRSGNYIQTSGSLNATTATFRALIGDEWNGLRVLTSASLLTMSGCIVSNTDANQDAIYLSGASNSGNLIDQTEIVSSVSMTNNYSRGIYMDSLSGGNNPYLLIMCSEVHGFYYGIYNKTGNMELRNVEIYDNYFGLTVSSGTALARRLFIHDNLFEGVWAMRISSRFPGLTIKQSRIQNNQRYQFHFELSSNVLVDSSNVFYQTGNNSFPVVSAMFSDVVMNHTWWGVYPTTAMMFNALAGSTITHLYERTTPYIFPEGCNNAKIESGETTLPSKTWTITSRNYPNPFNPTTTVEFSLPESSNVAVRVFDVSGNEVSVLSNGPMDAGLHRVEFSAAGLPSGLYLYEVRTPYGLGTGSMMLTK